MWGAEILLSFHVTVHAGKPNSPDVFTCILAFREKLGSWGSFRPLCTTIVST